MRFKFINSLNIYAIYSTDSKFYECVRIYQSYLCIFRDKYCSDDELSLCYYLTIPGSIYSYNLYNIIKASINYD